jgi:Uma2 family endonuclease
MAILPSAGSKQCRSSEQGNAHVVPTIRWTVPLNSRRVFPTLPVCRGSGILAEGRLPSHEREIQFAFAVGDVIMSNAAPVESTTAPPAAELAPSNVHRFTVDEYEALVTAGVGVFGRRNRLHLINGWLVEKMTQNPPHSLTDVLVSDRLARLMPAGWHLRGSKPIRIPPIDMPEPDQAVVRGRPQDYLVWHPVPADVGLVVEISDTSLRVHRNRQARLFGTAGIPVYWVVDINGRRIEVYTEPSPSGYSKVESFEPGQSVPVVLDGVHIGSIAGDDVLPAVAPTA